ncbi:hypothetical protein PBL1C_40 [Paenibacillus phage PBL1c]|uniref:Uncharacterized protein n=3 Tax=Fernvirus TaxID=2843380 RepID=A0A0K2CYJ3_9CAUD|nr:hypothetical protein XENIA_45 [Paenibacillus phage Xenia]YP_009598560.1 hypothetical protein FDH26_gp37 [Paenibacillus phage Shelly]YP_009836370.1 hypothetical protein HWB44_gp40 [Paenibacillus phage PBL1c]QVV19583.1 hypothetical protein Fitz_36 [Paenibacillus phage Fitz]QVV19651.1 hypothetical protein Gohan_39 [Paenibacillus phage Gohan]QVV19716.1 hypothetical protein Hobie_36 [Paenibacillus phage Hobie]QVV19966.1 hypothetical protein Newport_36 [Paenibacillus phage Newport]QVV20171.1 hy
MLASIRVYIQHLNSGNPLKATTEIERKKKTLPSFNPQRLR